MFFTLSKVFWILAQPISVIVLLVAAGLLLVARRRTRSGLWLAGAGLSILLVGGYTNLGVLLIAPLENRFERPVTMPDQVSAIIMLGGATDARVSHARSISELNEAGDRLMATLHFAERYPAAQVVLSGGSGMLGGEAETEASIAARLLLAMGVAPERLVQEDASRNTAENAVLAGRLVGARDGAVVLITSAFHMPRSLGLFQRAGLDVVPWPVDYRSAGTERFSVDLVRPLFNLGTLSVALREWVGLLVYAGTGRIDSLLPGPTVASQP